MTKYRCAQRLQTIDGVIHEVGDVVDLTGEDEAGAVKQNAVEVVSPTTADAASATGLSVDQLRQERDHLDQEIASMEHEGGTPS